MSADNLHVIRETADGKWEVHLHLSASCDIEEQLDSPGRTFDAKEDAIAWATAEYAEYGTEVIAYVKPVAPDNDRPVDAGDADMRRAKQLARVAAYLKASGGDES